jgi:hypothetical protein
MRPIFFSMFCTVMALSIVHLSRADEVVTPANGKGWGDGATAESLLKLNKDPEVVRRVDPDKLPIAIRGTCTDEQGHTYSGEDEGYSLCMNRKSSKAKSPAPTAATAPAPASNRN